MAGMAMRPVRRRRAQRDRFGPDRERGLAPGERRAGGILPRAGKQRALRRAELPDSHYLAFDEGRRFVLTDAAVIDEDGDFEPAGPMMIGFWEIEPEGAGTRYTARARHWTEEARQQHQEMGFELGWGACADQLKALCEER